MTGYIFITSLREFLRPTRVAAWLAMVVGVFLIGLAWRFLATDLSSDQSFAHLFLGIVLRVTALASAVVSALVVSQEVESKTITYWILRPVPRWQVMLGRLFAAGVASLAIVLMANLACLVAVFGPVDAIKQFMVADLSLLALAVGSYTGLFVLCSLFFSKALIVSLVFAFGWETFVPNMAGDAFYLSILSYLRGATSRTLASNDAGFLEILTGALTPRSVEPGVSWLVLALLTAVTWAACLYFFSRREFMPKEEGD
ncbi:MAG: ABC transporter permease [Fimbriimonadaceae bacterium]|nr:ABC transporter permease [Fimbriimonadaceae bacterium]QYK58447.1 MAG: ABC transporter permease [Fimbriimonadaceae bacterium]